MIVRESVKAYGCPDIASINSLRATCPYNETHLNKGLWLNPRGCRSTVSFLLRSARFTLAMIRLRSAFELAAGLQTAQAGLCAALAAGTLRLIGHNPGNPASTAGSAPNRAQGATREKYTPAANRHRRCKLESDTGD